MWYVHIVINAKPEIIILKKRITHRVSKLEARIYLLLVKVWISIKEYIFFTKLITHIFEWISFTELLLA